MPSRALPQAKRQLKRSEAYTQAELAKLEQEHARNLQLLQDYEEQKRIRLEGKKQ